MPLSARDLSVRTVACTDARRRKYQLSRGGTDIAQALAFLQSVLRGNAGSTWADATGMERA
jgi:hypothetical protein